jgi:uncharacterized damage-inducible protein DinB
MSDVHAVCEVDVMGGEQDFHEDQDDGYDDSNPYLPRTPEAFRTAWADLERLWGETLAKAMKLGEDQLHESVDGEWSFVQTLRHLAYASDLWVFAVVQGVPDPYDPLDLPFDGYARFPNPIPYERDARPPLADVLALRADRVTRVRTFLDGLTQEQIESTVEFRSEGWPFDEDFPIGPCLATVVNEEWHHRSFAERDLDILITRGTG